MRNAFIVSSVRTAVGKAPKGTLRSTRPDEMAATAIRGALDRVPSVAATDVDDVILGCAMPEAEQGMNFARMASLRAGLPVECSAMTVNRFCSSGLQSIALASERIMVGGAEAVVAGGAETMSMIPMGGHKIVPNPTIVDTWPGVYLNMGLTAERVASKYGISREEQDAFAFESHRRAAAAIDEGRFADEIVPLDVRVDSLDAKGRRQTRTVSFTVDEGPRRDTTADALAKLRPAFHVKGTVTAGNASQMSDGAAASLVVSEEFANARGLKPLARFVAYATAGVAPEEMGIGPALAIPKVLKMAGLSLDQIDVIELNEAFAAQALAVIRELGLSVERVNPNGGAIALGHPLGCTGAKLTASLLRELERRNGRYGMVTMCVGGGMGAAGIFERV